MNRNCCYVPLLYQVERFFPGKVLVSFKKGEPGTVLSEDGEVVIKNIQLAHMTLTY